MAAKAKSGSGAIEWLGRGAVTAAEAKLGAVDGSDDGANTVAEAKSGGSAVEELGRGVDTAAAAKS